MGFDEVSEPLYAGEQIHIPPELPEVLKQFTKAAIKTQPDNTYLWAAQYFEALAAGKQPPVKSRLVLQRTHVAEGEEEEEWEDEEYDEEEDEYDDVTIEMLDQLAAKLRGGPNEVTDGTITEVCEAVGFPQLIVEDVFGVGKFEPSSCNWKHFVTLACASLPDTGDLLGSMAVACQILGEDSGGMAIADFSESYGVLADLDPSITPEDKAAGLADFVTFAGENDGKVTAAAFGDSAAPAAGEAVAEEAEEEDGSGAFDHLLEGLAGGAAEVSTDGVLAAAKTSGVAPELIDVVVRVGKFGDTVAWANFAALLIANSVSTIEETAEKLVASLSAVGVSMDAIKAAHAFVSSLDSSQTAELIEERAAKMSAPSE